MFIRILNKLYAKMINVFSNNGEKTEKSYAFHDVHDFVFPMKKE